MDLSKVLTAVLVTAFNMPGDEVAALLSKADVSEEDLTKTILDKDKERVNRVKTDQFDKGHKKAMAEALSTFEKSVREQFNVEDANLVGIDLIKHVVEKTSAGADGKPKQMTDDQIKAHPLYVSLADANKKALKDANEQWQTKYTDLETSHKREGVHARISQKGRTELKAMNPVLPEDAKIADNQIAVFLKTLLEGKEFDEQGERIVITENGRVLEDGHGNPIDFNSYLKSRAADYFTFKATDVGGNADQGREQGSGGAGGGSSREVPKTFDEYAKMVQNKEIPLAERQTLAEAYMKANPQQ